VHSWVVRLEQPSNTPPANFLVGVAPVGMDLGASIGQEGCGIGLDYYGYLYVNGQYFHVSNLANWQAIAKPCRGSTARHKGKAGPMFTFIDGRCEITLTLDLKEGTLRFSSGGHSIGTIANVAGPLHAALTLTSPRQAAVLLPGPIGKTEHTAEELVNILKAKGHLANSRAEAAMLVVPRDVFVPRDRHREAFRWARQSASGCWEGPAPPASEGGPGGAGAPRPRAAAHAAACRELTRLRACRLFNQASAPPAAPRPRRDQKVTVRMPDGSTLTMPPPSVVATALEALDVAPGGSFLDVGCGSGYVTAVAAVMAGPGGSVHGIECMSSRLEAARANMRRLRERVPAASHLVSAAAPGAAAAASAAEALAGATLTLSNVLVPECTDGRQYDALYCDTSVSEEDLPSFLSLLRPGGRAAVVLGEELLLLTRGPSGQGHDFTRDVLTKVSGDFGELEDPTPWEVQEAIARIKAREHKRGLEQAKVRGGGAAGPGWLGLAGCGRRAAWVSGRSAPTASAAAALTPPHPRPVSPTPPQGEVGHLRSFELQELQQRMAGAMARIAELEAALQRGSAAPGAPRGNMPDDTRAVIRDARSHRRSLRPSPRSGGGARSPVGGDHGLDGGGAKDGPDCGGDDKIAAAAAGDGACSSGGGSSGKIGTAVYGAGSGERAGAELLASMGVQALSAAQVAAIVRSSAPARLAGYEVYAGSFKGTPCHAWRLSIAQPVSLLELQCACARFCCAHPNVAAILGACIEPLDAAQPMDEDGAGAAGAGASVDGSCSPDLVSLPDDEALAGGCHLWVVEERHGDGSLASRLERGLLSWQHVLGVAADVGSALAYLQTLSRLAPGAGVDDPWGAGAGSAALAAPLSPLAVAHMVSPATVRVAPVSGAAKLSLVPAMLAQLEFSTGVQPNEARIGEARELLLPYVHPRQMFGGGGGARGGWEAGAPEPAFDPLYGFGVLLLQLLTEQQASGLLGTARQALSAGTLFNLVPRTPAGGAEAAALAEDLARLALRCAEGAAAPGARQGAASACDGGDAMVVCSPEPAPVALEGDVLPALAGLRGRLERLGPAAVSWESVEELLLVPLAAPGAPLEPAARRWVRQDFRQRRRLFMEEAAKLAAEGPIHKIEVRRSRCFKDSVATFAGKGQNVWRQPLKVTFIGEAGMDSGGVTREWFSCICSALSRGSLDLFWAGGPAANQLYVNPLSSSPSHLKRFQFVGAFMAKALLESAARAKELGPISLNLRFCEPFWKLLLGIPLSLMDLQALDPTEFRSLLAILGMDVDGLIFESFAWSFAHTRRGGAAGAGGPGAKGDEPEVPALPASGASPFAGDASTRVEASIPLKPGGAHVRVTNANKREYVLLKAQKMLMGAVEAQMSAIIDAFHGLVPRELVEKYGFSPLEMQLLVCGEQVRAARGRRGGWVHRVGRRRPAGLRAKHLAGSDAGCAALRGSSVLTPPGPQPPPPYPPHPGR
jgi:protein-L-isoaspartate O-methyltransferase